MLNGILSHRHGVGQPPPPTPPMPTSGTPGSSPLNNRVTAYNLFIRGTPGLLKSSPTSSSSSSSSASSSSSSSTGMSNNNGKGSNSTHHPTPISIQINKKRTSDLARHSLNGSSESNTSGSCGGSTHFDDSNEPLRGPTALTTVITNNSCDIFSVSSPPFSSPSTSVSSSLGKINAVVSSTSNHSTPNYIRLNKLKIQQQKPRKPIVINRDGIIGGTTISNANVRNSGSPSPSNNARSIMHNRLNSNTVNSVINDNNNNNRQQHKSATTSETTSQVEKVRPMIAKLNSRDWLGAKQSTAVAASSNGNKNNNNNNNITQRFKALSSTNRVISASHKLIKSNSLASTNVIDPHLHSVNSTSIVKSVHVVNNGNTKTTLSHYSHYHQPRSLTDRSMKRMKPLANISNASTTVATATTTTTTTTKKKTTAANNVTSVLLNTNADDIIVATEQNHFNDSMPKKSTVINRSDNNVDKKDHNINNQGKQDYDLLMSNKTLIKTDAEENDEDVFYSTNTNRPNSASETRNNEHCDKNRLKANSNQQSSKEHLNIRQQLLAKLSETKHSKSVDRIEKQTKNIATNVVKQFIENSPSAIIFLVNENAKLAYRLANFEQKLSYLEQIFYKNRIQSNEDDDEDNNASNVSASDNKIPWPNLINRTRKWIANVREKNSFLNQTTIDNLIRSKTSKSDKLLKRLAGNDKCRSKSISKVCFDLDENIGNDQSTSLSSDDELMILLDRIAQFSSNIVQQQQQQQIEIEKTPLVDLDSIILNNKVNDKYSSKRIKLKYDWIDSMPDDVKLFLRNVVNVVDDGDIDNDNDDNYNENYNEENSKCAKLNDNQFDRIYTLKPNIVKQLLSVVQTNARLVRLRNEFDSLLCAHLKSVERTISTNTTREQKNTQLNESMFRNLKLGSEQQQQQQQHHHHHHHHQQQQQPRMSSLITESIKKKQPRLRQQMCHPPPPPPQAANVVFTANETDKLHLNGYCPPNFTSDGDSGGEFTGPTMTNEFNNAMTRVDHCHPMHSNQCNEKNQLAGENEIELGGDELSSLLEKIALCSQKIIEQNSTGTSSTNVNITHGNNVGVPVSGNGGGGGGGVSSASSGCCCSSTSIIVDPVKFSTGYDDFLVGGPPPIYCENNHINFATGKQQQQQQQQQQHQNSSVVECTSSHCCLPKKTKKKTFNGEYHKEKIYLSQQMGRSNNAAGNFDDLCQSCHDPYGGQYYHPIKGNHYISPSFLFPSSTALDHILSPPSLQPNHMCSDYAYPPQSQHAQVYNVQCSSSARTSQHATSSTRHSQYYPNASHPPFVKTGAGNETTGSMITSAFIFDPTVDVESFLNEMEKELDENATCSYTSAPPFIGHPKFATSSHAYGIHPKNTSPLHHHQQQHQHQHHSNSFASSSYRCHNQLAHSPSVHINGNNFELAHSYNNVNQAINRDGNVDVNNQSMYASIHSNLGGGAHIIDSAGGVVNHQISTSAYASCCSQREDISSSVDGNWKLAQRYGDQSNSKQRHYSQIQKRHQHGRSQQQQQQQQQQHFPFPEMTSMISNPVTNAPKSTSMNESNHQKQATITTSSDYKLDKLRTHVANLVEQEVEQHLESIEKWLFDHLQAAFQPAPSTTMNKNDIIDNNDGELLPDAVDEDVLVVAKPNNGTTANE